MSQLEQLDILNIIAENTTDIILFADNEGKVMYATPSLTKTLGYKKEDLVGSDAFLPLHPEDQGRLREIHRNVVLTQQPVTCEYRVFHEEGEVLYFEAKVKPVIDDKGQTMLSVVVIRDISDRKRAEIALRESAERYEILQKSILQLSNKEHNTTDQTPTWVLRLLFKLFEKDRLTISDELHDSILQNMIHSYRKVENMYSSAEMDDRWKKELSAVEEGLLDSIYEIRNIVTEIRPPFLKELGIVQILQNLFDNTTQFNSNMAVSFHSMQSNYDLSEEQMLGVYRITKELLNNALKHSEANSVDFKLYQEEQHFIVAYKDDGKGLNIDEMEDALKYIGISGIRKRIQSMFGTDQFISSPNEGLSVRISIPMTKKQNGGDRNDQGAAH